MIISVIIDEYSVLYSSSISLNLSLLLFMISSEVTIFTPLQIHSSETPEIKTCKVPLYRASKSLIFFFSLQKCITKPRQFFKKTFYFLEVSKYQKHGAYIPNIQTVTIFLSIILYK